MGRHIAGEPSFIVKYQPGVGGMVMANSIYNTAPRDGLTIGLMARANPLERVLENPAAKFENENFTWLGTASSFADDAYCLVIRADSAVKNNADAQRPGPPLGFGRVAARRTDPALLLVAPHVLRL